MGVGVRGTTEAQKKRSEGNYRWTQDSTRRGKRCEVGRAKGSKTVQIAQDQDDRQQIYTRRMGAEGIKMPRTTLNEEKLKKNRKGQKRRVDMSSHLKSDTSETLHKRWRQRGEATRGFPHRRGQKRKTRQRVS